VEKLVPPRMNPGIKIRKRDEVPKTLAVTAKRSGYSPDAVTWLRYPSAPSRHPLAAGDSMPTRQR
jgi:hypothetical protein